MKTELCFKFLRGWPSLFLLLGFSATRSSADLQQPTITSIRQEQTNVVVTTRVPSGLRKVTLECRERVGAGTWEPRAVARLDGTGGLVTFRLALSRQLELIRVRGDSSEPLPASFYGGTNDFFSASAGSADALDPSRGLGANPGSVSGDNSSRAVVESDIWNIRGQTLYFFNQFRGLQVIDISNPDAAAVRGTLDLPAAGEQMYLLGTHHVVLLARNGCYSFGEESQVVVVAETNGLPTIVAKLPVKGFIQESRMVGTALYVASQTFRPMYGSNYVTWEWGTVVSAFDLADPDAPVSQGTLWYSGYGNVVAATDVYLFVVTQDPTNWWQSIVRVIDITDPNGTMREYDSVRTAGRVPDKFKLDYTGTVFTSISEDWHWDSGRRLVTKLETFRLPDPRSLGPMGVVKLGELELGNGERLRATRFDDNRVYVVTFFQIDPLWVVDLSNPAAPSIVGSVDVPGWSTYIQPLGDRLVSVGVESNRVAVSLFDVHDPTKPALLSRVRLGENYSWSEANYNEKAFTVLPQAALILVPYNGYTTNGFTSRVQLIDLNPTSLVARGLIEHEFHPRRATLYANRILSLSGWELLSVDATDRDNPVVRGSTELAWSVDRLFLHGDFLIEVTASAGWSWWRWWNPDAPALRVSPANTPNQILNRLSLTNLPVLGAVQRGNRLYLAQGTAGWFYPFLASDGTGQSDPSSNSTLLLTIVGLDRLPVLPVLGQVEIKTDSQNWGFNLQALWPKPDLLVWVGGAPNFWWWRGGDLGGAAPGRGNLSRPWPFFWGGNSGRLLAFDVSDPQAPHFASEVNVARSNWWSFSKAFAAEELVYLSHETSEFIEGLASPWQTPAQTNVYYDEKTGQSYTNITPAGTWVQRFYLDVVDYADAKSPTVRQPVNIPGTLTGLSHQGALLYSVGTHWTTNWSYPWTQYLDALAYDGVAAHLVDSLALPTAWPHPVLASRTNLFIGHSGYDYSSTNVGPHYLETWTLSGAGKFNQTGNVTLGMPASLLAEFPGMLAAQETDNTTVLFDLSNPAALRQIGQGKPAGCLWYDLNQADGEVNRGLWSPLGIYGVATIPVSR